MGTLTYNELNTELGFLLGNRTDTDSTNATRLSMWLHQAYTYITHPSVHKFREVQAIDSITLVTGDNEYDIGAITSGVTTVAIRWVVYVEASSNTPGTDRQKLDPVNIRWLERRRIPSGRPIKYAIDNTNIYIYALPRTTENGNILRIGLYREPAVISGTDTTVINSYFDRPLLKFAQAFAESDLGDRAKSLVILKEATGLLNNAAEETEMEAEDDGNRVEFMLSSPMGP